MPSSTRPRRSCATRSSSFDDTLGAIVDERARDSADRPFITFGSETISYGEFAARVWRLTAALHELGIRKGDKLALFLPNGLPFALWLFACARLGALFVPAHEQLTARELKYVLQHSDAVAVLTDAMRLAIVEEVRDACPLLRHIVLAAGDERRGVVALAELLNAPERPELHAKVGPSDHVGILYTSGTTGQPKGVLLTHRGYMLNAGAFADRTMLSHHDVVLSVLPLAHLNAQRSSLLPAALSRSRLVLAERFSATTFWRLVRMHDVTFFSVMPTIVSILLHQPPLSDEHEHNVRLCVTPITLPLLKAFEARFGILVVNTYGLTEGMLNVMNFIDPSRRRRHAIGKPLLPEIHQLRIVDDADNERPPQQTGEIVLRSPAVMAGYYKDPEATAQALRGGWLHTGDLGYVDEEGYLYFVGRKKEMIRRAGENISPAEIESVLASHRAVQEAVVVGVSDPLRDEEVKACIILRPGEDENSVPPTVLIEYCTERLATFKIPRYLEYRRDFPRTPATLRVQRGALGTLVPSDGARLFDRTTQAWIEKR